MNKSKVKNNFIKFSRSNQEIIAGLIAVIAFVLAINILFPHENVGVIDYGEYTQTLYDMGLSYTKEMKAAEESLRYEKVIETFQVDRIKILQILQLEPSQSLIYPVSVVSILCKLFHVYFSTKYLAFLLMCITVLCIYSITRSAYYFLREKAAAIGIVCCIVLLCGNYIIFFNSLYRNGIYFVSVLSFFSILLHIVATGGKGGYRAMLLLLFTSLLLLNATATTIVYLPIVVVTNIAAMIYCRPYKEKRISYYFIFILLLVFVIRSNVLYTLNNNALFSNTQMYHSFFTGVLEESEEKEMLLTQLGIDSSLSEDVGKNAYLSAENYVVNPNGEDAEKLIFSHLNYTSLGKLYLKYPELYVKVLKTTATKMIEIDTHRFLKTNRLTNQGTEWVELFVWWQWIRTMIVPKSLSGYLIMTALSLILFGSFLYFHKKNKEKCALIGVSLLALAFAAFQFGTIYAWQGYAEEISLTYYFILPCDVLLIFLFGFLLHLFGSLKKIWTAIFPEEIEEEAASIGIVTANHEEFTDVLEELFMKNPLLQVGKTIFCKCREFLIGNILSHPNRAAFLFMINSSLIVFGVLFYPTRIGAYNNGDFGRMMTAMNISYRDIDWEHSEELSLTKVVEKYDWVDDYDYAKLLPNHADLSQIWFSVPLKIIDNYVGLTFSTVYVTIIYAVIILISIFFIMHVLFHRFGARVVWFAFALIFILLDLVNLGWLNSLFGEGIAFVSLLMVIACVLKIADMERGTARFSFLFLFFSELLFIGAKAQFTLTTPLLMIGSFTLFYYHMPIKIWKKTPYFALFIAGSFWLSLSAVNVYQNNSDISAPDTIYQSVFYGLLMLVDDPKVTLEELGLDPAMAVDAGKHAYLDKSEYYCPPRTKRAEEMLYSKISTIDILKYYMIHPRLLWKSMEYTAEAAAMDMPDYIIKVGQKTTQEHDVVERFHIWGKIRSHVVFNHFWELILVYGLEIILMIRFVWSKKNRARDKMLLCMFFMISAIGILQYPLTFIGNGFADNTKQLYLFRLTFDITLITGIYLLFPFLRLFLGKLGCYYANKSEKSTIFLVSEEKDKTGGNIHGS